MKYYSILFVLLLISLSGCVYDPPLEDDNRLVVHNNSHREIYCFAALDTNLNNLDKVLSGSSESKQFFSPVEEIPASKATSIKGASDWEDLINFNSEDSVLYVFIAEKSLVDERGWDYVLKEREIIRHRFTIPELEKTKWKIMYNKQ
jgi:hypothetical protein